MAHVPKTLPFRLTLLYLALEDEALIGHQCNYSVLYIILNEERAMGQGSNHQQCDTATQCDLICTKLEHGRTTVRPLKGKQL